MSPGKLAPVPNIYPVSKSGSAAGFWNETHTFTYGGVDASAVADSTRLVSYLGSVPCCINASVQSPVLVNPDGSDIDSASEIQSLSPIVQAGNSAARSTVQLGTVLGMCNPSTQAASITWLGRVWKQNMTTSSTTLLTINLQKRPGGLLAERCSQSLLGSTVQLRDEQLCWQHSQLLPMSSCSPRLQL